MDGLTAYTWIVSGWRWASISCALNDPVAIVTLISIHCHIQTWKACIGEIGEALKDRKLHGVISYKHTKPDTTHSEMS